MWKPWARPARLSQASRLGGYDSQFPPLLLFVHLHAQMILDIAPGTRAGCSYAPCTLCLLRLQGLTSLRVAPTRWPQWNGPAAWRRNCLGSCLVSLWGKGVCGSAELLQGSESSAVQGRAAMGLCSCREQQLAQSAGRNAAATLPRPWRSSSPVLGLSAGAAEGGTTWGSTVRAAAGAVAGEVRSLASKVTGGANSQDKQRRKKNAF